MQRSCLKDLVASQAVKYTNYSDFRQLAVDRMVRTLIARDLRARAIGVIEKYEKTVGKNAFTATLWAACR